MKNIKTYLSVFAVAAMCVVGYSTYTDITISHTEKLVLLNIEALTTDEPDRYDCSIGTMNCKINFSQAAINALAAAGNVSYKFEVDASGNKEWIDLTDATTIYAYGQGHNKCGDDVTCNKVLQQFGLLKH